MDETRARQLCASTCKHVTCTGRGDLSKWAHRCQLAPVPELAPVFTTRTIPPSPHPSPSEHRTPHAYGPHDPTTAPTTVLVLRAVKGAGYTEERPLPDQLVRQRATINRLAHER